MNKKKEEKMGKTKLRKKDRQIERKMGKKNKNKKIKKKDRKPEKKESCVYYSSYTVHYFMISPTR